MKMLDMKIRLHSIGLGVAVVSALNQELVRQNIPINEVEFLRIPDSGDYVMRVPEYLAVAKGLLGPSVVMVPKGPIFADDANRAKKEINFESGSNYDSSDAAVKLIGSIEAEKAARIGVSSESLRRTKPGILTSAMLKGHVDLTDEEFDAAILKTAKAQSTVPMPEQAGNGGDYQHRVGRAESMIDKL